MNNTSIWHILGLAVIISAIFIALTTSVDRSPDDTGVREEQHTESRQTETAVLTIEGLYDAKEVTISEDDTVLSVLKDIDTEDGDLQLVTKDYGDMGILVESIGGMANGTENEYWQYKVNGEMPLISADQFELESGDVVEWYFAPSEF